MSRLADIAVDDDVLARARAGDERARAAIYSAVAPGTFGLIRRLSGNPAQAEDLFQDTMMALYQHLDQFRGEAPLGAWVQEAEPNAKLSIKVMRDGKPKATSSCRSTAASPPAGRTRRASSPRIKPVRESRCTS